MKELKIKLWRLDSTSYQCCFISSVCYVNLEDASVNYNNERQWWERTEGIIASNQMAHDHKMTVMLKPHLWANHGFYTGWFSSDAEWKKWESIMRVYSWFCPISTKWKHRTLLFRNRIRNAVAKDQNIGHS
jgi:hypothetical protein